MHSNLLFLDNLGGGEIMIIAFFILLFFGSEKIPGLMRSLGRAMREFRTAMDDVKSDLEKSVNEPVRQLKDNMEVSINEPINSVTRNFNKALDQPSDETKPADNVIKTKQSGTDATGEESKKDETDF
ncbi:MAG: twin-arginine translocase TatA/TatE family subunit [Bacteroidia bacterium]